MEATLHGVTGPGTSLKVALKQEEEVTVGRTEQASLPLSDDLALSSVHFAVTWQGEQILLRDLSSTNGTFVNGVRVDRCVLRANDIISAGQSSFRVELRQDSQDPFIVLAAEPEPLFAILDAARHPRVLEMLRTSGGKFFCLYQGRPAAEMELVSPYLVPLALQGRLLEQIVAEGWGKSWGIFFTCEQPIATVWQHLSRSLMVTLETEGTEVYFRYYDPRVLREIFPIMDTQQLAEFCGPIQTLLVEDEQPDGLLRFTRPEGRGKIERITVRQDA